MDTIDVLFIAWVIVVLTLARWWWKREKPGLDKARVVFLDPTQAMALLNKAVLGVEEITGVRYRGQAEEGWYTYPLSTVREIAWEEDSDERK